MEPAAGIEIERKYLLAGLPPRVVGARRVFVRQGWLENTEPPVRLREVRIGGRHSWFRAVKSGLGLVRTEREDPIRRRHFRALWPGTAGVRIRKYRYVIPAGELNWEIDAFLDLDLVLAEVELPTADTKVVIPDWLAPWVVAEVTEQAAYTNLYLARHGPPSIPAEREREDAAT